MSHLAKCRYRCRRGLLELDVILQRFSDDKLESLSDAEQETLLRLLETPDPVLLQMVLGEIEAPAVFSDLVALISSYRLDAG